MSIFLKLAFIYEDPDLFLLAAEDNRRRYRDIRPKFDFSTYEASRFETDFRFTRPEIIRLSEVLGLPKDMRAPQGTKFTGIDGLCITLRRLAYPNRLADLQSIFGLDEEGLSHRFNTVLNYIFEKHGHLVTSLRHWWLEQDMLQKYSDSISVKGAPLNNCFGFIDGTIHRTCRPKKNQRECYSGHKRVHGLKYQSVVIPNGLIANLYGPLPGRRHDSFMLNSSKLLEKLDVLLGAQNFCLFGDNGYPLKRHLLTPYTGSRITQSQKDFNMSMSQMRICVEWEFGELFEQFAFLDFKKNQKIYLQPVYKYFVVATILKNCKTCLHGSQTSNYFGLIPPTLESYVKNDRNA